MTQRPLMQTGIEVLETHFRGSKENAAELSRLEEELAHRTTQRAASLLHQVRLAKRRLPVRGETSSNWRSDVAPDLFDELAPPQPPPKPRDDDVTIPTLIKRALPQVAPQLAATPKTDAMSVEEACRILKVSASTTWEVIEQARRALVDRAHPDNLAGLSTERRNALQDESRRVNAAYRVLAEELR